MKPDLYIIVAVLIAMIVAWKTSRVYHQARDAWVKWRTTVASIPGLRKAAFAAVKLAIWMMLGLALWFVGLSWFGQYR